LVKAYWAAAAVPENRGRDSYIGAKIVAG
jgi:hypothetical protein